MSYIMTDEFTEKMESDWRGYDSNCEDAIRPVGEGEKQPLRESLDLMMSNVMEKESTIVSNLKKMDRLQTQERPEIIKRTCEVTYEITSLSAIMTSIMESTIHRLDSCMASSPESAYVDMKIKHLRHLASIFEPTMDALASIQDIVLDESETSSTIDIPGQLDIISKNLIYLKGASRIRYHLR